MENKKFRLFLLISDVLILAVCLFEAGCWDMLLGSNYSISKAFLANNDYLRADPISPIIISKIDLPLSLSLGGSFVDCLLAFVIGVGLFISLKVIICRALGGLFDQKKDHQLIN